MDRSRSTRLADADTVEYRFAELRRRQSADGPSVVRACSLNLVVACASGRADLEEATRVVARVSETAPGRAIVIAPLDPGEGAGGLEASVSTHCRRGPAGVQVCCEQVTLRVRGDAFELVPGTVLQLLVGDLPVHTWWRRSALASDPLFAPLLGLSGRLIADVAHFGEPERRLAELDALATTSGFAGDVADLTWLRSEPWREALASFFDAAPWRASLERIVAIEVSAGGSAASALVAGWLASRLGWVPGAGAAAWRRGDGGSARVALRSNPALPPGEIESVHLRVRHDEGEMAFIVERGEPGSDLVRLRVEPETPGVSSRAMKLPAHDDAALVCGILQRASPDPVLREALSNAVRMAAV